MTEQFEYFYIKVGFSNSFIESIPYDENKNSYLWIGYEGWSSPVIGEGGLIEKNVLHKGKGKDLDRLYAASSIKNRTTIRLFGFSSKKFYIWEITNNIIEPENNKDQANKLIEFVKNLSENQKKWITKNFRKKKLEEVIEGPIKQGRYVPVKCIFMSDRENLPPTVNTLAVYQYFSRGTFRNLSSIGPDRNQILEKLSTEKSIKPMPIYNHSETKLEHETYYGKFFRCYFDSLFVGVKKIEISNKLIWGTLNPVQLEAFVSLLCLELGYTVDFFTANSVDSIDVFARKSLRSNLEREIMLRDLFNFCGINEINTNILKFQCKAYFTTLNDRDDIILFTPTKNINKKEKHCTLSIEEFFDWREKNSQNLKFKDFNFNLLDEWLDSLKRFYNN